MKNNSGLVTLVIIFLLIVGGVWYTKSYQSPTPASSEEVSTTVTPEVMVEGEVSIMKNLFFPETITIKEGETVTWVNKETYGHDAVSDTGLFRSPRMATGEKYSYTFTKAGTYTYICGIHPFMHGTVIVTK